VRPSVLERQGKRSSPALPIAIAAALVLMLVGGVYAFRVPLGSFVSGVTAGLTGEDAYESGKAVGQASNPVGTSQAATLGDTSVTNGGTVAANIEADRASTNTDAAVALNSPSNDGAVATANDDTRTALESTDHTASTSNPDSSSNRNSTSDDAVADTRVAGNDDGRNAAQETTPAIKRLLAAREDRREERREVARAEPREVAAPKTPRIAVVTIGDNAITGPARQRIEERLTDAGFDVIDSDLVAGVEGRGDLPGILRALRGDATVAIVVRADAIGSAPITFYGQVDTMYNAHLGVRAYLVGDSRPLGAGFREQVNFTGLSAAQQAEEVIAPRLDRLMGDLASYRRRRG
jgi:serine/threonine-protein kinase